MSHKIAFYPCCARDFIEPLRLIAGLTDVVYFCDKNPRLQADWTILTKHRIGYPEGRFLCLNALDALEKLERIDVLFYRRDSGGEGGSGLYVLGKRILPMILNKFPLEGGLIITDGSNSGSHLFKKMIRPIGLKRFGWLLKPAMEQRLLDSHKLWIINVTPESKLY